MSEQTPVAPLVCRYCGENADDFDRLGRAACEGCRALVNADHRMSPVEPRREGR